MLLRKYLKNETITIKAIVKKLENKVLKMFKKILLKYCIRKAFYIYPRLSKQILLTSIMTNHKLKIMNSKKLES